MGHMSDYYASAEHLEEQLNDAKCELSHAQDALLSEIGAYSKIAEKLDFAIYKLKNIQRILNQYPSCEAVDLIKIWVEE